MPRYYKQKIYEDYERRFAAELFLKEKDKKTAQYLSKNPMYYRDRAEAHAAAFRAFAVNAVSLSRNKI